MSAPLPVADRSSFDRVLDALGERAVRVNLHRAHIDARCPAHSDRDPSLSVDWKSNTGKGGITMLNCHAGCDVRDVLDAIGLRLSDTYDTPAKSSSHSSKPARPHTRTSARPPTRATLERSQTSDPLPAPEAEYAYCDADGVVLGWMVRYRVVRDGVARKTFRWATADPTRRTGRRPGQPKPCPLYQLPLVRLAVLNGRTVDLCEGEKDADAVTAAGGIGTTIPNGATRTAEGADAAHLTDDHLDALRGAHVRIWADRDGPDPKKPVRGYTGYHHAAHVADRLDGIAASVQIVEAADGKDAVDHLAAGHTLDQAVEINPLAHIPNAVLDRWAEKNSTVARYELEARQAAPAPTPEPAAPDTDAQVIAGPWKPTDEPATPGPKRKGGNGGSGGGQRDEQVIYIRTRFAVHDDSALVRVEKGKGVTKLHEVINARVLLARRVIRDMGHGLDDVSAVDLEITQDGHTYTVSGVPWADFESCKWVAKVPTSLEFNRSGSGKSTLINAILQCSGQVPVETAYGTLGWREIAPDHWVYIHAGGAIDASGALDDIRVDVSPRLKDFVLPAPPTGDELRTAYESWMTIMDTLPDRVAVPLLGAAARAVLGDCSSSLFLVGSPGTYKSGVAALVQQAWDPKARYDHLPAGAGEAAATAGGMEHLLYEAGHSILVLDDLAPDRGAARSAARGAELIRTVGNKQSKLRSNRDANGLRADREPRAMIIITGEDQPTVQSAETRTIYIKLNRGDVTKPMLVAVSQRAMIKARRGLTAALVQHAATMQPTAEWLEDQRALYADHLGSSLSDDDGLVARRCGTIAELATGWRALFDVVVSAGIITPQEALDRWTRVWAALAATRDAQFALVDRRGLPERAADLIRSALRMGRMHLEAIDGGVPNNAVRYGWIHSGQEEMRAAGDSGGWTDDQEWVMFDGGAMFAVLEAQGRAQGDELGVTQRALKTALIAAGLLVTEPAQDGRTPREVREKVGGQRQRVWKLPLNWLYPDDETDQNNPMSGPDKPPPLPCAPSPGGDASVLASDVEPEATPEPEPAPEQGVQAVQEIRMTSSKPAHPRTHTDAQTRSRASKTRPTREAPVSPLGGSSDHGYFAAGVVADVDSVSLIGGSGATVTLPEEGFSDAADLLRWATTLAVPGHGRGLGIRRPGGRDVRQKGVRDDAGLVIVMPALAKQLGFPAKAPARDKTAAQRNKVVTALTSGGWKVSNCGLQPYTEVWPADGGPATYLVQPAWVRGVPIFEDITDPALLAYRLMLYINNLGIQLIYSPPSTGAELLRQVRAYTDTPLLRKVLDVPPPGKDKAQAPIEDGEWDWMRAATDEEQQQHAVVVGIDVHSDYLASSASAKLGDGRAPTHEVDVTVPDDLRNVAAYWLVDLPESAGDPRMPDLVHPTTSHVLSSTRHRWITTPYLIGLREAGYTINHVHEAWSYPGAGCHLQVWSHKIRDARYSLEDAADPDDLDLAKALTSVKLTYSGGLGMLGSEKWKKGTELWLPHDRHTTIGLAMINRWRKVRATATATGRHPLAIIRDTIYYPAASIDDLPAEVPGGFKIRKPGDPYRLGQCSIKSVASLPDYVAARAVTDKRERAKALEAIFHPAGTVEERSE